MKQSEDLDVSIAISLVRYIMVLANFRNDGREGGKEDISVYGEIACREKGRERGNIHMCLGRCNYFSHIHRHPITNCSHIYLGIAAELLREDHCL